MNFWFDYKSARVGCHYDYSTRNLLYGELDLYFETEDKIVYNYNCMPFYYENLDILKNCYNRKFKELQENIGNKIININGFEFRLKKEIRYIKHEHGLYV